MCVSAHACAHNSHRDQRSGSDALMLLLQLHEPPNVGVETTLSSSEGAASTLNL